MAQIFGTVFFLSCFILACAEEMPSTTIRVAILRDVPKLEEALTKLSDRKYHGTIRVIKNKQGSYFAVNILDIEDYLLDAVGCEMDPNGPLEALKAQAIAARSHALYQASLLQDQPYDLVANLSQAYLGRGELRKNAILAIETTRGQLLSYEGNLIPTYFHASCGGHTESVASVWQSSPSTKTGLELKLPSTVVCPYCSRSTENKWSLKISVAALQKALKLAGYKVADSSSITIAKKTPGGHALIIAIRSQNEEVLLPAEKFRSLVGYSNIRSTLFDVHRATQTDGTLGDYFIFNGDGYGHGVGLCQFGAEKMAKQGASYQEILSHYFPNSCIWSGSQNKAMSMK